MSFKNDQIVICFHVALTKALAIFINLQASYDDKPLMNSKYAIVQSRCDFLSYLMVLLQKWWSINVKIWNTYLVDFPERNHFSVFA